MKKTISILIILLLASCAHGGNHTYVIPAFIKERSHIMLYGKAYTCLNLFDEGISSKLFIHPDKKPNAWIDIKNNVYLTEGIFKYDDDTIAFILSHELSHAKLKHLERQRFISQVTTWGMLIINGVIPGSGLFNLAVNPAITNNFSKSQELEADKLASKTLVSCFGISVEKQVHLLESFKNDVSDSGGFWDRHPSWSDRIENIRKN